MSAPVPQFDLATATSPARRLWHLSFGARGRTFRGGILGTIKEAPMGKGHKNDGKPFDVETACYLKPVFASIENPAKRKHVIMSGVKTLKSFMVEAAAVDHVVNGIGDVGIFFGTAETADDVSSTRILSYFEGVPLYQEKMRTIEGQWDYTMGAVKFPDKTLWIKPANLANAQQKNLCFVGVQDAFVCEANGMIDQLIERTTQYPNEKKIVLESQGGEDGFDFDRHYTDTNQAELHVLCPYCESKHIFNWRGWDMTRGDDFKAVLPKAKVAEIKAGMPPHPNLLPQGGEGTGAALDAALETARKELTEALKSEKRRRCGFKRGAEELIKLEDGSYNEAAILRETHYECYHCGSRWLDTPEIREQLDRSSFYVASNPKALPENDGFSIAQWINRRLPWGHIMLQKLKRQKIADELGNKEPLKQWWQKFAGRTWNDNLAREHSAPPPAAMDGEVPTDALAMSATDIQFKGTHMVYVAMAYKDGAAPRLLHYEWVKPPNGITEEEKREFCKNRVRELDKLFKVEPQNSMKDGRHEIGFVREWAAEDAMMGRQKLGGRWMTKWFHYGILLGDDAPHYRWRNPGRKRTLERFSEPFAQTVRVTKNGHPVAIPIEHRLWSNYAVKEIVERWRDGNSAPRIEIPAKFLADQSKEGLWQQLNSERLIPWKGHPGKFHYNNEGRDNHAWDALCMIFVRMDQLGYLTIELSE